MEVEGYVPRRTIFYSNQAAGYLSRLPPKRAEYIANYLIKNGIPSERITHMGKGATEPITTSDTNKNREKNRRVEIIVTDN